MTDKSINANDVSIADCSGWTSDEVEMTIYGYDNRVVVEVELDECKQCCEEESEFNCLSVDYMSSERFCFLSAETKYTVPDSYKAASGMVYSMRTFTSCTSTFVFC